MRFTLRLLEVNDGKLAVGTHSLTACRSWVQKSQSCVKFQPGLKGCVFAAEIWMCCPLSKSVFSTTCSCTLSPLQMCVERLWATILVQLDQLLCIRADGPWGCKCTFDAIQVPAHPHKGVCASPGRYQSADIKKITIDKNVRLLLSSLTSSEV